MIKKLTGGSMARRRILAIVLAMVMSLSLGFALNATGGANQAYAATNNPYMMSYDLSSGAWTYRYILDPDDSFANIEIGPAQADATGEFYPTYFTIEQDADTFAAGLAANSSTYVEFIDGDGIPGYDGTSDGTQIIYANAYNSGTTVDQWSVKAIVQLPVDGSYGTIVLKIKNPNAPAPNNTTSIAIIRDEEAPPSYTTASDIDVWIQDPANSTYYQSGAQSIPSATFYENPTSRTYPTALDAVYTSFYNSYIPELTYISYGSGTGLGDYVQSMTVNGVNYAYEDQGGGTYNAWAYAVYRNDGSDYIRTEIGQREYASSYMNREGDLIVWVYGKMNNLDYDDYYNGLFPDRLP
jgi:hypothetical protein